MHLNSQTRPCLHMLNAAFAFQLTLAGCNTARSASDVADAELDNPSSSRILVLGDIQQKDEFLLKDVASFSKTQWDEHQIDTTNLQSLNPKSLLEAVKPDDILQVGDLVDFNNGYELEVKGADGSQKTIKPTYDEWKTVLSFFETSAKFYPTVGNHETYKLVRFHGTEASDGTFSLTAGPNPSAGDIAFTEGAERQKTLTSHFPHLKDSVVFYGNDSGTYFAIKEQYCLLSIDGASIVSKKLETARQAWSLLKPFIESNLARCSFQRDGVWVPQKPSIVTIHYPLFSALAIGEQEFLDEVAADVVKVFNAFRVAVVLSGHEHLYMRYLEQGYSDAGYSSVLPLQSTYVTVANFGVPGDNSGTKLRGIGKTPAQNKPTRVTFQPSHAAGSLVEGNGSKFFLAEDPTIAVMIVSKDSIKFVAKTKSGSNWDTFDSFGLKLMADGTWKRTDGIAR